MTYAIQRTYGKSGKDYLHAWDEQYGTACIGAISQAMTFATKDEAEAAAARAQAECKGANGKPATGVAFAAVEVPALNYANRIGYSDIEPFEVVREVSEKIIEVRRMNAELDPNWKPEMHAGGFAAHCSNQHSQRWNITSNEAEPVIRLHKRKDGCFYYCGSKFRREAAPRKFYDYNF